MRVIFAGTPEFAAKALAALVESGHCLQLVLTQPDRPAGRGMNLAMSAVKEWALGHGMTVAQPLSLRTPDARALIAAADADVMVVAAYGLILPREVLALPRHGCLNIHASLLPRWRGAAPIQRALLAGDQETGITIMRMDEGLDTGPMLLKYPLAIRADDTAESLHDRLSVLGAAAIVEALARLGQGKLAGQPQDEAMATYAPKLTKAEARLDWSLSAAQLERAVRAYVPFPVAHTNLKGETWRIWKARVEEGTGGRPGEILRVDKEGVLVACGDGALLLQEIQKAGGRRLPLAQFLQGHRVAPGEAFDT